LNIYVLNKSAALTDAQIPELVARVQRFRWSRAGVVTAAGDACLVSA
jgi:hypothetical protein